MDFGILGPLRISEHGRPVILTGQRRRALLLRLLAGAGHAVPVDTLVEDLWDGTPPAAADATLKSHMSALRKIVPSERLRSQGRGYVLEVDPSEIDANVFERATDDARAALAAGRHRAAAEQLDVALTLWRGAPFADVSGATWARPETTRLEEIRSSALEALLDARLALGEHTVVVAGAEAAVHQYPLQEGLWCRLMIALYRSGRQADAVRAYGRLRALLGEELGLEPSSALAELEASMIRGEPISQQSPLPEPTRRLPAGTITLLLTDVVGSAALWEEDADAMRAALLRHDELIAEVVSGSGGQIVKDRGEGDSTFNVFGVASDAVRAAILLAERLSRETWPTPRPLRMRMALHSGEARPEDDDYRGEIVNRAARLRALGSGGQVLLSASTAQLVVDQLPAGAELLELGVHSLRGLRRPETVYTLAAPGVVVAPIGGRADHPEAPAPLPARVELAARACFVGRRGEQQQVRVLLDELDAGGSGVVLVEGEPGIGKTAFAARVAIEGRELGATILHGGCVEGMGFPYQPIVEMLEQLVEHAPVDLLAAHVAERGAVLARLVPALRRRVALPGVSSVRDPETERALLGGAIAALLAAAAEQRPLVLVMDDLHWADMQTLQLVRRIATRPIARLLVLATCRSADPRVDVAFAESLAALHREPSVERVALSGLGCDDAAELLVATAGGEATSATEAIAAQVCRDTGGNPFFLNELLRHSIEAGILAISEDGSWVREHEQAAVPLTVREVVGSRVDRLGTAAGPALSAAAVVGIEFDLELGAATAGIAPSAFLDVVDDAIHAGLVHEVAGRPDRFRFDHALVRSVLHDRPSSARTRRMHGRAADHLEARGAASDDRVGVLAHHRLVAAVDVGQHIDAAALARRAGEHELANLAPEEAVSWFERATETLDLATRNDDATGVQDLRLAILVGLGDAQRQAGDERHRSTLLDAARLAREHGDTATLVRAALANNRGWESHVGELDDERIAVLREAIDGVGDADGVELCRLLATLAIELQAGGEWDSVDAAQRASVDMARRIDDPRGLLHALEAASAGWVPRNLTERLTYTAEAVALARELDDPAALHAAATHRVSAAVQAGDLEDADAHIELVVSASERLGLPHARWTTSGMCAWRALLSGDIATAEELAETNLVLGMAAGQPDAFTVYGSIVLGIRLHQGRGGEFIAMLEHLADANPRVGAFRASLAFAHTDSGALEAAAALLAMEGAERFSRLPDDALRLPALALWAAVAGFVDDADAGAWLHEALSPWCGQVVMTGTGVLGAVDHFAGIAALAAQEPASACKHFAVAAAVHERFAAPFLIATTRCWRARALGTEERGRAIGLYRMAHQAGVTYGYAAVARHAVTGLEALGVSP